MKKIKQIIILFIVAFLLADSIVVFAYDNPIEVSVNAKDILFNYLKDCPENGDTPDDIILFYGEYFYIFNQGKENFYFVEYNKLFKYQTRSVCFPGDPGYPRCDLYKPIPQPNPGKDIDWGKFGKCLLEEVFDLSLEDIGYNAFVAFINSLNNKAFEKGAKVVMKSAIKAAPYVAALRTAYYAGYCLITN